MNKSVAIVVTIVVILVCQSNSIGTMEEKISDLQEGNTNLRKLGFDGYNIEKTFPIKEFLVLGQKLVLKYKIAVKDGKAINHLIIDSNLGRFNFGNKDGVDSPIARGKSGRSRILTFRFPPKPEITIGIIANYALYYTVRHHNKVKDSLDISLIGEFNAIAEVVSNPYSAIKIYAKADGTIIRASCYATVAKNNITDSFKFTGTEIKTTVEAKSGTRSLWRKGLLLFENWTI